MSVPVPRTAEIQAALVNDLRGLLVQLGRGEPNKRQSGARELRYGRKGSLSIVTTGAKAGAWYDNEAGEGGGPLKLIERELGIDGRGARDWALRYLGWEGDRPSAAPRRMVNEAEAERKRQAADEAEQRDRQRRLKKAAAIYAAAQPTAGTPAETYLRRRGITGPLPDCLRWQENAEAGFGALVVPAVDADGSIPAVQRIFLTDEGHKAPLALKKRTNGALAGAAVRFPGWSPLILAEGPETALSIWHATGRETWAVLGISNFATAPVPAGSPVVLAADDFAPGTPAEATTHKGARALADRGCRVSLTRLAPGGGDFNDVLQRDGAEAVAALIEAAEPWRDPEAQDAAPTYSLPTLTADEARQRLGDEIKAFMRAACEWAGANPEDKAEPPQLAVPVGVALGKTRAAIEGIADLIRRGGL